MTDEEADDLDRRYYRHQDSGQHGEDDEPRRLPDLRVLFVVCIVSSVAASLLAYGLIQFIAAAWRWS